MPSNTDYARANHARATDLRSQLRAIDRVAEGRAYSASEQAQVDGLTAELRTADEAVGGLLDMAAGAGRLAGADPRLTGLANVGGDGAELDSNEVRRLGGAPPLTFSRDTLRSAYDAVVEQRAANIPAEVRTITAPAPSMVIDYRLPPVTAARESTRVVDLIPAQSTEHASVTYYTTVGSASAAYTAESTLKPESAITYSAVNAVVHKLATWVGMSSESVSDYPAFAGVVQDDLLAGLELAENNGVLNGPGTGVTQLGLVNQPGILAYAPGAAEARLFSLRHAIKLLRVGAAFATADAVIMHPTDVEVLQSMVTTQGALVVAPNPLVDQVPTVWSLPVIQTSQITAGTALVGAFSSSTVNFVREAPRLTVDPYTLSTSNIIRVICEERFVVACTRPAGLCLVTFHD